MTPKTSDRMLSPKTVADLLGVGRRAVYAWIKSGELPAVDVTYQGTGRRARWRIRLGDLWLFVDERTRKTD